MKLLLYLRAYLRTFVIWAAVVALIVVVISINRAAASREVAALASTNQQTRDKMTLNLTNNGTLTDVLTNTEDPNTDANSPQNVKSLTIRENAAASVNQLSASHAISDDLAMTTMFQLCKDANTTVQGTSEAGLKALGEKNDSNLMAIVNHLQDGDPQIRTAAVAVLGLVGVDPGFGDKTARMVNSVMMNTSAQASAELAMQKIGAPAVPYLQAYLNNPDIIFRQAIVTLIGAIGTPGTVPVLQNVAVHDVPSVRRIAVVSLATIVVNDSIALTNLQTSPTAQPQAIQIAKANFATAATSEPLLIKALQNTNGDSQSRSQSALALGDIGGARAISVLDTSLSDYDNGVRIATESGFDSVGAPAVPTLIHSMQNGTAQARATAAEALGGIGNSAAIAAISNAIANPATTITVRLHAIIGLGRSGNLAAIPVLIRALSDPDGRVQTAASDALLAPQLSNKAVTPLIATFTLPTPVPFNASSTLAQMGNQAVPELEKAVSSANPQVKTWAAITLGRTNSKDPSIVQALTPLAKNQNPHVQYAASQALNALAVTAE